MNQAERRLFLIETLLHERPSCRRQEIPQDAERQKILLRGLMNVRAPRPISDEFLRVQTRICSKRFWTPGSPARRI